MQPNSLRVSLTIKARMEIADNTFPLRWIGFLVTVRYVYVHISHAKAGAIGRTDVAYHRQRESEIPGGGNSALPNGRIIRRPPSPLLSP